jgi:hypothetical protein
LLPALIREHFNVGRTHWDRAAAATSRKEIFDRALCFVTAAKGEETEKAVLIEFLEVLAGVRPASPSSGFHQNGLQGHNLLGRGVPSGRSARRQAETWLFDVIVGVMTKS